MDCLGDKMDLKECFSIITENSISIEPFFSRIINKDLMITKEIIHTFDLYRNRSSIIEKYYNSTELFLKRINSICDEIKTKEQIDLIKNSDLLIAFFQSNVARQIWKNIGECNFKNIIEKLKIRKYSINSKISGLSKIKKMRSQINII